MFRVSILKRNFILQQRQMAKM